MTLSKKNYLEIAYAMASDNPAEIRKRMIEYMSNDNPRFNKSKFAKYLADLRMQHLSLYHFQEPIGLPKEYTENIMRRRRMNKARIGSKVIEY